MTTHELKIKSEYFMGVVKDIKKAEIRYNDRNYQVGDFLVLYEIDEDGSRTGNQCTVIVSHILDDTEYLRDGYVMLSIAIIPRFILNEERTMKKPLKTTDDFNAGDIVIFKNIFAKLAGRVRNVKKDKEGAIFGYEIMAVDKTFSISTYSVSAEDIVEKIG
jgi:transcription antitermination factor NusG